MSTRQDSGSLDVVKASVVVAVKVCKAIPKAALTWALTNVVRQGDCVRLLVIIPSHHSSSKTMWGFPHLHSDCTSGYWGFMSGTILEQKEFITDLCKDMMHRLHDIYDPEKVTVKMKVVHESKDGVVASEAKRAQAQWVVLDKGLKKEANFCMEQLDCNVIVVKHSEPKVLRLHLIEPRKAEAEVIPYSRSRSSKRQDYKDYSYILKTIKVPNVTPTSSPDRLSSVSSLDMFTSQTFMSEINWDPPKAAKHISPLSSQNYDSDIESKSESDSDNPSSLSPDISSQHWNMEDYLSSADEGLRHSKEKPSKLQKSYTNPCFFRKAISLNVKNSPDPPPLCSVCHHRSPSFGQPPKLFSYAELARATDGFSRANFLAEGGYGSVHRGILPDGQLIAVKQHRSGSSQGDREFCAEVQVLSCAQHRNVVMLIGYCVEDGRRLLVYEYICNGSLDSHLYGRNDQKPLDWIVRQKIAVGAARGLRYLHEECRVGCIVHRDMRPNNILLTHDFEPLVGDFGLARLQLDGESGVETRIIGTFGYIAPEYAQTGKVCERADVYSFGVVLVELITGRKAVDINRPKGEQCLTEWARPLLEENALAEHIDPCLMNCYAEKEVETMLHCALLCLQRETQSRPRMSQVLRLLEGDISMRWDS